MSRFRPVTLAEFEWLLEEAQSQHKNKGEPIPKLKEGQLQAVDSCLNIPFQTFDRKYLYHGFLDKAAMLFYVINKNHPLSNGNKRMACLTLAYFCFVNNKPLFISDEEFYDLAKEVTQSDPKAMEATLAHIKKILRQVT